MRHYNMTLAESIYKKRFLFWIITIFYDNSKRQKSDRLRSTNNIDYKKNIHTKKVLLCIWWDMKKMIYHKVLNPGKNCWALNNNSFKRQNRVKMALLVKTMVSSFYSMTMLTLSKDNKRCHLLFGLEVFPHIIQQTRFLQIITRLDHSTSPEKQLLKTMSENVSMISSFQSCQVSIMIRHAFASCPKNDITSSIIMENILMIEFFQFFFNKVLILFKNQEEFISMFLNKLKKI